MEMTKMANGEEQTAATRINQSAVLHGFSNNSEDLRSMGGANNINRLSCFPSIEGTTATTSSTTTHPKFASYHFLIMSVLLYGYFLHHSAAKQELRACVRILIHSVQKHVSRVVREFTNAIVRIPVSFRFRGDRSLLTRRASRAFPPSYQYVST